MASARSLNSASSQRRKLRLGVGIVVLIVLQLLAYQLWLSYREQVKAAETTTRNYAAIFETRFDATLRRTDAILQELSRLLPADSLSANAFDRHDSTLDSEFHSHLRAFDELIALRVYGAKGDLLYSSDPAGRPAVNIADQDYFRVLRERPGAEAVFSDVLAVGASGPPSLIVARGLKNPGGDFIGVVTAQLDLERYQRIFQAVDLGAQGSIVLRRSDDQRLVVRWPHVAEQVNKPLNPQHPVRQRMLAGETTATLHFAAQSDGIERIYSLHRLERYPFYFIIGVSRDEVLAGWRTRALVVGASGVLLLAVLSTLLLRVWRSEQREARMIADLLDSERQLRADLSERQQVEERNRQLLAEMQTLLGNAMVGIVHLRKRRVIYCNRRIEEIFGFAPGELVGESSERFYASREIFEEVGAKAYAVVAEGREFSTEMMLRRKDGSLFWGALTGRAIDPAQPQQGSIWVFADISERRRAEDASQKLLQAVEQSPVAIVITNRSAEIEYVNPSFCRISGYSRQEALGRNPGFLKAGETPDETYQELWRTLLAGEVWSGLLHNRRKNGELFWEQASISPVLGDDGEVTHYLAVKEDVSERRVTETRLRLLAGVFEHSAEAIMVSDRDNRILEVNQSFSRLTGYSAEEVRGMDPRLLSSGRSPPDDYRAMWQSINTSGHWQGEIWDRRKDGSCYPKWLAISTIRGTDGKIEYYIGSFVDISERKAAEEKISHLAHFDTLTDLPNRSNLQGRLDQALAAARRNGQSGPLAVMFLDLDRFKNINDTLGHHIGDALLLEVAQRLRASVRDSDVVARLGGDEFVVVLTGSDAVAAERVAGKILSSLAQAYHFDGYSVHTTSSIGIAVFPGDGESVEVLMRNADAAMYHAKAAGRNNVKFFTASMNEIASDRRQVEEDLHLALQQGQFVLHYQPQFDRRRRAFAAEALLRWQHPTRGLLPPPHFIPLAEDSGLIVPIGQWVLEAACAQLKAWSLSAHSRELQVAVNVSARQFRQADFVDQLGTLLSRSGAVAARLKLELTESLVLDNVTDTIAKMSAVKRLGVTFAMDDFGTGYSSLSYLSRLPIDQLKIDRAFVSRLPDQRSDAVIAQTIISMGHNLGLKVVAEGVETEAQCQFLDSHGCDGYQGFLFSRPLPVADLERLLTAPVS